MRRIEIIRAGDATVTDLLAEMREWLQVEGIEPVELEPDRILGAVVRFRAGFDSSEDAERFRRRFDEIAQTAA
jgi:hypothetical protein